jgi:putative cell wall-binding protein
MVVNVRTSFMRRLLVLAVLGACTAGVIVAPAHAAVAETELAGRTRFETAVEISQKGWPGGSGMLLIATGMNWPDALGGSVVAGWYSSPILLVEQDSIPDVVWAEINRLNPVFAFILGGEGAVGPEVQARLQDKLGASSVLRIAGNDRYETANAMASHVIDPMGAGYSGMAFVATGADFPDSLAVGPVSGARLEPIFLSNPYTDTAPVALMKAKGVKEVVILGGTRAVSLKVEYALEEAFPGKVTRISGANRYETGADIARYSANRGMTWNRCCIATGENYPDALAGGPFAQEISTVMLITPTNQLHSAVKTELTANKGSISEVHYLGGTDSLSETTREQVRSALN